MDVFDAIRTRRSIREYKPDEINKEDLEKILEAGRWAPSAENNQPWNFVVVTDDATIAHVIDSIPWGKFMRNAPLIIAIVTDPEVETHIIDGALVTQNMALEAWDLNIGTCWVYEMDRDKIKKILGIPKEKHVLTVLGFGYISKVDDSHACRKELEEITHYGKW